jgi:transcriptional/translational regulatory protein YebC/TACO1
MGRKWANIVAKKTAKDGANSKVYAKFGVKSMLQRNKEIQILSQTQN